MVQHVFERKRVMAPTVRRPSNRVDILGTTARTSGFVFLTILVKRKFKKQSQLEMT